MFHQLHELVPFNQGVKTLFRGNFARCFEAHLAPEKKHIQQIGFLEVL